MKKEFVFLALAFIIWAAYFTIGTLLLYVAFYLNINDRITYSSLFLQWLGHFVADVTQSARTEPSAEVENVLVRTASYAGALDFPQNAGQVLSILVESNKIVQ
jgi:hypothetical protein